MAAASINPAIFLRQRYIIALTLVASVSIISQTIIQATLVRKSDDSRLVNIAGRQRMLSQKLTKAAMGVFASAGVAREAYIDELAGTASLLRQSHAGLMNGNPELGIFGENSGVVRGKLQEIEPRVTAMASAADELVRTASSSDAAAARVASRVILANEAPFLADMDAITFLYDREARERMDVIRIAEYALLVITILLLALEARFIFIPAERHIALYFREYSATVAALNEDIKRHVASEERSRTLVAVSQRSIERAKMLQRWMITSELPTPNGFDVSALYIPSENLSGDLFIVRELNDQLAVILADATGHGIAASMSANLLWRYIYRFEKMLHDPDPKPGAFIACVNAKLCENDNDELGYPTMSVTVIDVKRHSARFANAGGVPPFYFNGRSLKQYARPHGMLLGLKADAQYLDTAIDLDDHDTLFFTSDGLVEERVHYGVMTGGYSDDEFQELLRDYPDRGYLDNLNYLYRRMAVRDTLSPLHDDTSMVLVKVDRDAGAKEPRVTVFL